MKRSVWKLPFIHSVLFKKKIIMKDHLIFKIRNSIIPKNLIDKHISVYNGAWYLGKDVSTQMVGYKLGEFSFTKRCDRQLHLRRKSKKKSKKK